MTLTLQNREFKDLKQVKKYFQDLLYNSTLSHKLEGEQLELLMHLATYHPDSTFKLNSGIHYITVDKKEDTYGYLSEYPRYFIQCWDGSEWTFPYTIACKSFAAGDTPSISFSTINNINVENISLYQIQTNRSYFVNTLNNLLTYSNNSY